MQQQQEEEHRHALHDLKLQQDREQQQWQQQQQQLAHSVRSKRLQHQALHAWFMTAAAEARLRFLFHKAAKAHLRQLLSAWRRGAELQQDKHRAYSRAARRRRGVLVLRGWLGWRWAMATGCEAAAELGRRRRRRTAAAVLLVSCVCLEVTAQCVGPPGSSC